MTNTIEEALKRRQRPGRPCSFCGHDRIRHGIGNHAVEDRHKTGGRCVDCHLECKAFQR